ncbi:MAG: hypothetical protein JST58_18500 [Bacteroidetes bacterium]|nr:hypothetical protein [Bacteroidota bacterium]
MFRLSLTKFVLLTGFAVCANQFYAVGQDSTKRKSIDITSQFKPVLREAAKINFQASPATPDTSKPRLIYNIPSQFLLMPYQPGALKPVALQPDSVLPWHNDNYIKVGAGSVHLPYIKTGFSFGDGKSSFFNLYADEYISKGKLPFQQNSYTNLKLTGTVKTQNHLQWDGAVGYKSDGYYLYGFKPDTLKFTKDQLKQNFQTFSARLGMQNLLPTEFGLTYHPEINISVFSDNHNPKATEANTVLNLPLQKQIGDQFAFRLSLNANLTNYRFGSPSINNNIYYVAPALLFKSNRVSAHAEITPSWDQHMFHLLPNFKVDIDPLDDKRFTFEIGWVSYYDKGSYQRYASINPWIAQPDSLLNTRVEKRYAGFKGTVTDHVTYSASLGYNQYWNMPLFVNDSTGGGKNFLLRYDPSMKALELHGEIAYIVGEQFSLSAGLTLNQYSLQKEARAWGLLPLELNSTLRWQILKDLWLKSDLWAWDGAQYLAGKGQIGKSNPAFDLNAGVEFRITRQLNLWLQMNNIFNDKYERWNQYQSYGFNILGGIVFSFGDTH